MALPAVPVLAQSRAKIVDNTSSGVILRGGQGNELPLNPYFLQTNNLRRTLHILTAIASLICRESKPVGKAFSAIDQP